MLRFSFILLAAATALLACGGADTLDETSEDDLRGRAVGKSCSEGTFGTPNKPCRTGLVCVYPDSTAPADNGAAGSAKTGTCWESAELGELCGDGVFGQPKVACERGLECVYPAAGTAPSGPPGSSSATAGRCQVTAQAGETCGNGVYGTPDIACTSGLECVYPEGGTQPSGPEGSSSATTGRCE